MYKVHSGISTEILKESRSVSFKKQVKVYSKCKNCKSWLRNVGDHTLKMPSKNGNQNRVHVGSIKYIVKT